MKKGYVYFFKLKEEKDIYKIGSTYNDLNVRLKQIEYDKGYKLDFFHAIESSDYKETEKLFHLHFAATHVEDELFQLSSKDVEWVKKWQYSEAIMQSIFGKVEEEKQSSEDLLSVKQTTLLLMKEGIVKGEQGTRRHIQLGALPSIAPPKERPGVGHRIKKEDVLDFIEVMKMDRGELIRDYIQLRRKVRKKEKTS